MNDETKCDPSFSPPQRGEDADPGCPAAVAPAVAGSGSDERAPAVDVLSASGSARRQFLRRSGAMTTGAAALRFVPAEAQPAIAAKGSGGLLGTSLVPVTLRVNGHAFSLKLEPRVTLLDALRDRVGLTGTKKGCDRGQCGACTVLVEGRRINSCLTLAVMHDGESITTVEGLAATTGLHPMQQAFIKHDGFQCGYCTPGQICSAVAMLGEVSAGTVSAVTPNVSMPSTKPVELSEAEVRERMSGNLCRCGAYVGIVAAIQDVVSNRS